MGTDKGTIKLLAEQNEKLERELYLYKTISRAVYELVNVSNLETWIDSYRYGEGVDAVEHLKTLVESTQDVTDNWSYHKWCGFVEGEMPHVVEEFEF